MINVLSEYGILKCYPFYNYRESFFKYEKYENRLKVIARYLEDMKQENKEPANEHILDNFMLLKIYWIFIYFTSQSLRNNPLSSEYSFKNISKLVRMVENDKEKRIFYETLLKKMLEAYYDGYKKDIKFDSDLPEQIKQLLSVDPYFISKKRDTWDLKCSAEPKNVLNGSDMFLNDRESGINKENQTGQRKPITQGISSFLDMLPSLKQPIVQRKPICDQDEPKIMKEVSISKSEPIKPEEAILLKRKMIQNKSQLKTEESVISSYTAIINNKKPKCLLMDLEVKSQKSSPVVAHSLKPYKKSFEEEKTLINLKQELTINPSPIKIQETANIINAFPVFQDDNITQISVCMKTKIPKKTSKKAISSISFREKEAEQQFMINQLRGRVKSMEDQIKQKDACIDMQKTQIEQIVETQVQSEKEKSLQIYSGIFLVLLLITNVILIFKNF